MKKPSQSQPRHFARLTLGDYGACGADPPFEPQWPRSCYDGGAVVISLLRRLTGRAVVMSHRGMVCRSCVCSAAVSTVNRQHHPTPLAHKRRGFQFDTKYDRFVSSFRKTNVTFWTKVKFLSARFSFSVR